MDLEPLYTIVRKYEGLSLTPYLCPAGVWTIGYGHTGPEVHAKTPAITEEEAEALLQKDCREFVLWAIKLSPILVFYPERLCAIADFCYNLGQNAYKVSTLKRMVDEENWDESIEQIKRWVFAAGKRLPGLVKRRNMEAELLGEK